MSSRIIMTDPHGCLKTLKALVAKLPPGVPITVSGDLIDRGPDSRGVIDLVRSSGWDCTRGNHEQMMIDELKFRTLSSGEEHAFTDAYHGIWEMNGGDTCLESYKVDATEELNTGEVVKTRPYDIPALKADLAWLKTLPYFIEYPEIKNDKGQHLLVSHTTASRVWGELSLENPEFQNAVIWDRDPFPPAIDGIFNIYGHTPQKGGATVKEHFACIDGGAYFKRAPYGKLIAIQFPEMIVFEQENVE